MRQRRRRGVTRREALSAFAAAGAALAGWPRRSRAAARAAGAPPNILFILSDNHRWDAMSCMRHPFVRTPYMDRLGREGVHFANAFCTTPLCSPARASFLTGLYAWRHGVHNNANRASWDESQVTFLELLQRKAGYRTAFIGKWHMPGSGLPRLRGVDHFVTFTVNDGQGRYRDCPLVVDGVETPARRTYLGDELTERALHFIGAEANRPFCLYLSHKAAHYPWTPSPDFAGTYADATVALPPGANSWTGFVNGQVWGGFDRSIESAYRSYMETVSTLDRDIGRLLARLEELDILDRTAVVYASDNGFLFGEHGKVELRWPFEEVLRIPLLVRYPPLTSRPGQRAPQMAINLDLAPTFLQLAGVAIPAHIQGMSLVPVLRNRSAPGRRAWLVENYTEFPYRAPAYQGVHTERYLYVEYEGDPRPSLHDLRRDPRQMTDLYGSPAAEEIVPALQEMLRALRAGRRFDG